MSSDRISAWTWSLIFAGMLFMAIGLTLRRSDAVFGWLLIGASGIAIAAGVVLIWVRSKMDKPE
jgi:Zinc-ribbon containing domain